MMGDFDKVFAFALLTALSPVPTSADPGQASTAPATENPEVSAARVIPAGTPVLLRVESPVSSKTALRGDLFDISLASDIVVDGQVLVLAGAKGKGEVIHVQGKGFGGRAGELLLAARYIVVNDMPLKLRGFAVAKAGANNTAEAITASLAIPIVGVFVTGTSAEVTTGHVGQAKTLEAFGVPPDKAQ